MQPQPLHLFALYYLFSVTVETAVLVVALSRRHTLRRRLLAGVWLTACTYPVVWYVLPFVFDPAEERLWYLLVAETFAPAAECLIFLLAFVRGLPPNSRATVRDVAAITLANLASFGVGELVNGLLALS
jgi:hypothetical protein